MKAVFGAMAVALGLMASAVPAHALPIFELFCQGGGGMIVENINNGFVVKFERATKSARDQLPLPGQCTLLTTPIPSSRVGILTIDKVTPNALLMLAAAKGGGTFQVQAFEGTGYKVSSVGLVVVEDAGPADDDADVDVDAAEVDNDDEDEVVVDGGQCALSEATVSIPEPNLKKLNVRKKPGGKVVGTVPEGDTVEVVGPCGSEAAAGLVKGNFKKNGASGWCKIESPIVGCVMAKYLDFEGGGVLDDGAGLVKKN